MDTIGTKVIDMPSLVYRSDLESSLHELGSLAAASTVKVRSGRGALGSGVVWQSDGEQIVTNAHVAFGPRVEVELPGGSVVEGEVVGRDRRRDLASIEVPELGLPPVASASAAGVRVGELVMAVGNPFGVTNALALGVIHAVSRSVGDGLQLIRADLRLAPGYSGGPMLDSRGRIIGINTMVSGGLGLAIGSDEVTRFLAAATPPWLGVRVRAVQIGSRPGAANGKGLLIVEVLAGSAAARAGILAGDILVTSNGVGLMGEDQLRQQLELAEGEVQLELLRGSTTLTLTVLLAGDAGRSPANQAA